MNRRAVFALVSISAVAAAGIVTAAPATAAPKKPGLYGPTTAVVGEEVAVTTVFLAKDRKNVCFSPDLEWGDAPPRPGIGICMKFGFSGKYERAVDTYTHVFSEPGTYTVSATAAGMSATGMPTTKPSLATVKGPKRYTRTIVVSPAPEPASSSTATPEVTS